MIAATFWLRYVVRSLRRGGRRAIFAGICITVGIAGVVALQLATLTVQAALTSNVRAANGGDISVASTDNPLSASDLRVFGRLQRTGQISAWTAVAYLHATAVGPAHALIPFEVNVVSVPPYPLGGQPTFVSPSNGNVATLLRHSGDVLMTNVLASELGARIGDRLLVNSIGGRGLSVTVRGILAETNFEHAAVMTVERRDLAVLSNSPLRYTAVYVDTSGNSTAVASTLRQQFPLATVQTVQEALQSAELEVHDFRQFMLLVGLLALLIAGIGILNAMQSMLTWRRLEIAMLKAMGYGQPSLYLLFGGEAVLLGFIGGVAGTILGAVGSSLISDALANALAIQVTFQFDPGTLASGIALGIGATLIFALLPIVRAAAFRPLELLREGAGTTSLQGFPRTMALTIVVLLLYGALAAAIIGNGILAAQFVAGTAAAFIVLAGGFSAVVGWIGRLGPPRSSALGLLVLLIFGAATAFAIVRQPALSPILALATIVWAATVLLPRRRLLPLLMAVRSLSRRQTRTAVTLVAFLVGVLAMSVTLTVALSLQGQINSALATNGSSNLVAVANSASEQAALRAGRKLPGLEGRSTIIIDNTTPTAVNGQPVASVIGIPSGAGGNQGRDREGDELAGLTGLNLRTDPLPTGYSVVFGRGLGAADSGTNHVLVRSRLLNPPWNLRPGDRVTLRETGSGLSRTVQVVGFYQSTHRRGRSLNFGSFFLAPILGDQTLARTLGGSDAQSVISFTINPNHLTDDAAMLQREVSGILVVDVGDLTRVVDTILGELLNLLAVITALALGAGLAVVANGVALAMLERRREIALLKAIGFTPGKVMQFVLVENALAGTLAGAVSVLAVVISLSVLSRIALDRAIGFDPVVAILVLLIAAALAVATSYAAARSPVRVRPLEALRNE